MKVLHRARTRTGGWRFTAVLARLSQNTHDTRFGAARLLLSSLGEKTLFSPPRQEPRVGSDRNSLYCNLFYSTFPWRKLKKKKRLNASCFLSLFCSFEQIALAMFFHTAKWNDCLSDFVFCFFFGFFFLFLILKIYLHKVSLCNPLLLQMSFFVVMLLKLIFHVLFIIRMNINKKNTVFRFFFYDVCMNICSVTSCEDKKPLKPHSDLFFFFPGMSLFITCWGFSHTHAALRIKVCHAATRDFPKAADRSPWPTWSRLSFLRSPTAAESRKGRRLCQRLSTSSGLPVWGAIRLNVRFCVQAAT